VDEPDTDVRNSSVALDSLGLMIEAKPG